MIPWWFTQFSDDEIQAFAGAVRKKKITQGSICLELEKNIASFLKVPYAALTSSCSGALFCSLIALGIKPGDEVILPAHTFIAAANAVHLLGAKVVLADVLPDFPLLDPENIPALISESTRAVIAVNLNGRCVDIQKIRCAIQQGLQKKNLKNKIRIIEDSAQSFASKDNFGRYAGTRADIGVFSMGITKLFSTGEGGFAVTSDPGTDQKIREARNHGSVALKKNSFVNPGFNLRLTDMMASVGLAQFAKINDKINRLIELYSLYESGIADLKSIRLIRTDIEKGQIPLWIEIMTPARDQLGSFLEKHGIQTKAFHPCLSFSTHLFNHETTVRQDKGSFINSSRFASQGLVLPSGPDQSNEDIMKVISVIREFDINQCQTNLTEE
jgi:dTDP-4-amino-4,6-dideoxygalactose transaminase